MAKRNSDSQTEFQAQAPLYERAGSLDELTAGDGTGPGPDQADPANHADQADQVDRADQARQLAAARSPTRRRRWLILGGAVIVLMTVAAAALLLLSGPQQSVSTQPPPLKVTPPAQPSSLEERVVQLEQLLDEADPSGSELPFPPVDMDIRLEQ
ncbi:MAG: hypothetical protein COU69_00325 [Candidatus Pacebacteria bacterium CG10_big_fil_rev_8_21_14_0_10_56_10]|nr:MAG: hypothetical protein COU69_00325 [Candidatus Pacebacteria bacterium CG10_big_fil_rev_8_21_14_0_10_56_10]